MITYNELVNQFTELYGQNGGEIRIFEAPGRVNLIGEHIDYNGGFVFPAALNLSNVVIARKNNLNLIRMAVTSLPDKVEANINNLEIYKELRWGNYQLGIADVLQKNGTDIIGLDLLYNGTVPYGSGLSSSASIEIATLIAFEKMLNLNFSITERAKLAQRAENEYVGVKCGIMDQFASAAGKAEYAIFLDCSSLYYELVPLNLANNKLLLIDSCIRHNLGDSKYNERRTECDKALELLKTRLNNLNTLCDATCEQLNENLDLFGDKIILKRARHAISENERTKESVELLKQNNIKGFGQLMNESHISLRDDFEVSCKELDFIFEFGQKHPSVSGLRMTGAGFGGCVVAIIDNDSIEAFKTELCKQYKHEFDIEPLFYSCEIGNGGREIDFNYSKELVQGKGIEKI